MLEKLSIFWNNFTSNTAFTIAVVVSVILFTLFYFFLMKFLIDNNSSKVLWLIVTVTVLSAVIIGILVFLDNDIKGVWFLLIPALFMLLVFILYPVEIKRYIWKKGIKSQEGKNGTIYDEESIEKCINEIIKALQDMSKNDVGAIIVLSNGNITNQILESGVKVNSDISSALIESIFFPKTPLHDGAMIIDGTKIVASGCFLPLSQRDSIPKELGSRHRAGLGVTESLDVITLIVSEETGVISIARGGKLTRYADQPTLKKILSKYYWQELESSKKF